MTTIWFAPCCPDGDDCRWAVWFRFDQSVVDLVKRTVAADARSFDDDTKLWFVEPDVRHDLAETLRAHGHAVEFSGSIYTDGGKHGRSSGTEKQRRQRREQADDDREERRRQWEQRRQEQQQQHRGGHYRQQDHRRQQQHQQHDRRDERNWAEVLLNAVGAERADAVFRSLSKVLHPDTVTGEAALMRELIAARERLAAKASR